MPDHVLGLTVAAYSLAAFLVNPFAGRWVDKPGRSRTVLIIGACLHIAGAMLEIFLSHHWFTILARFLSGLGSGSDAVVISEISRYTLRRHRTSTMAVLVCGRLVGFLFALGLDALLWRVSLIDIELPERRKAFCGLVLAILWAIILLLTAFFFTELCRLQPVYHQPSNSRPSFHQKHSVHKTNALVTGTVISELGDDYEVVQTDASFSSSLPISIPASLTNSQCSESAGSQLLGKSSEMIEEAEKYIQQMAEQSYSTASQAKTFRIEPTSDGDRSSQIIGSEESEGCVSESMSTSFNHGDKRSRSDTRREADAIADDVTDNSLRFLSGAFDHNSYVTRAAVLPRRLQEKESLLYIMYEEFIRPDMIVLLTISSAGFFAHLCFQMAIVPTIQRFLKDQLFYIVILFILALILLVTVCLIIWWSNPKSRTTLLLVMGTLILIADSVLFMMLINYMDTGQENYKTNMVQISVCVGLFTIGLPLLAVCATSIFTLQSSADYLGLSQGVYSSVLSISGILAPFWIVGTWTRPYLLFGVVIGLLSIAVITVLFSRGSLAFAFPTVYRRTPSERSFSKSRERTQKSEERQHLLT